MHDEKILLIVFLIIRINLIDLCCLQALIKCEHFILTLLSYVIIYMKKGANSAKEKLLESKILKNSPSSIKFNLSECNLACFKGKNYQHEPIAKQQASLQFKKIDQESIKLHNASVYQNPMNETPKDRSRSLMLLNTFNEKVVFMRYDNIEMYVDKSTRKNNDSERSISSKSASRKDEYECEQDEFVSSCVRVITQETDNTSNHLSKSAQQTSQNITPRSSQNGVSQYIGCYPVQYYQPKNKGIRNKRTITSEQSRAFLIQYSNIESDGRTTIMIKNIPNKYTQDMLYEEFSTNHQGSFDFFYLPIDKNNECNVGYAFVNFVSTSHIKLFYNEFHNRKWKKYKSPKICQLYYARYQGTQELAEHFRYTKILQKDKKIRPMFGYNSQGSNIKDLKDIIQSQLENKKSK